MNHATNTPASITCPLCKHPDVAVVGAPPFLKEHAVLVPAEESEYTARCPVSGQRVLTNETPIS